MVEKRADSRIKVLIADDHPMVRNALVRILSGEKDILVLDSAVDGLDALQKALDTRPDVILMDMSMPNWGGLEAVTAIHQLAPLSRILILTLSDREIDLRRALRYGACGFLLKTARVDDLLKAVRRAAAGEAWLPADMVADLLEDFLKEPTEWLNLTGLERDSIYLLARGLPVETIARDYFVSESMVRLCLGRFLDRVHRKNREEASAYLAELKLPPVFQELLANG
jgi:DNA-binding NarL/FixJ family response regulator